MSANGVRWFRRCVVGRPIEGVRCFVELDGPHDDGAKQMRKLIEGETLSVDQCKALFALADGQPPPWRDQRRLHRVSVELEALGLFALTHPARPTLWQRLCEAPRRGVRHAFLGPWGMKRFRITDEGRRVAAQMRRLIERSDRHGR